MSSCFEYFVSKIFQAWKFRQVKKGRKRLSDTMATFLKSSSASVKKLVSFEAFLKAFFQSN